METQAKRIDDNSAGKDKKLNHRWGVKRKKVREGILGKTKGKIRKEPREKEKDEEKGNVYE